MAAAEHTPADGPRSGIRSDGGLLTAAVGLSAAGDTLAIIPLAGLISEVSGSGFLVGALFAALWAPMVVLAPLAGWLADRFETTRLLLVVSLAQAAIAATFVFATGSIAAIIAIAALVGSGHAIAQAAEFSLAPAIESGDRLKRLNGRVEAARYIGMTAGPAAGVALAAAGGITIALLGNALTFLFVAAAAGSLRTRRRPSDHPEHAGGPSARDGFAHLFAPSLRLLMVVATFSLFLMTAVWTAEPFFAREVLDGGDLAYGVLMSAWTLGMAIGAIGIAARVPARLMVSGALAMVALQGFGLLAPTIWLSIPFAAALYVIGGLAHGTKNTLIRTLIHERVPDAFHGRAAAAYNALRNGAELLALGAGGTLVATLGARTTVSLSGALPMALGLLALLWFGLRARSHDPSHDAVPETAEPARA
jgi:MFS family permease